MFPPFDSANDLSSPDHAEQFLEWLGLFILESDRILGNDSIDPYLSRYEVPDLRDDVGTEADVPAPTKACNMVKIRWHGFISPAFTTALWMTTWKGLKETGGKWAAMNVSCFGSRSYTIYSHGTEETLSWECD